MKLTEKKALEIAIQALEFNSIGPFGVFQQAADVLKGMLERENEVLRRLSVAERLVARNERWRVLPAIKKS